MKPHDTWCEAIEQRDLATARFTRRLTCMGTYNSTPTYHYNSAFTADSRYLVLATAREGRSALLRADVQSGELTVLLAVEGFGQRVTGSNLEPFSPGPEGQGGITGTRTALLPASGWVVTALPRRCVAVHVESGQRRDLYEFPPGRVASVPGGNASGRKVYLPMRPVHPDADGHLERPGRSYAEAMLEDHGGIPVWVMEVDIETGAAREVYHDPIAGTNHVLPSPTDDDLLLLDRDRPPTFAYYGDNCQSPRAHLLRLSTGELTPLRPRNAHQFQSHSNWNRSGDRVFYHGPAFEGHEQPVRMGGRTGEMFLGVSDLAGEPVFEKNLPCYHYGHVSTHTRAEAIITDGLLTPEMICAVYYRELDAAGCPRVELLGRHGTDWQGMIGQYRDPHCHMSPDGRWVSYNAAARGRSDVYLLQVG